MEQQDEHNLNNRPRQHPFTVPDGYFDDLPMRIQQRVQAKQPHRALVWDWLTHLRWQPALATACVLVVAVWFAFLRPDAVQHSDLVSVNDLTETEILTYLSAEPMAVEASDLATVSFVEENLPAALPELEHQDLEDELDLSTVEEYYYL